jgi:short-chain Z-isoprenyl diphosphate synthase
VNAVRNRLLKARLRHAVLPRHVAMVMDGNRRWARRQGLASPSDGHRRGIEHLFTVLGWCRELGIRHVTIYLASGDNLRKRESGEVQRFLGHVEEVIAARPPQGWRLHLAGRLDLLPGSTHTALTLARESTRDGGEAGELTFAVGYDGREEIVDALRSLLAEQARAGATPGGLAQRLTPEDIAAHLYGGGRPDPDLIIRTGSERRLSGFLLWQAAHAELHFCDVYWPGLRRGDFLRAMLAYSRLGG